VSVGVGRRTLATLLTVMIGLGVLGGVAGMALGELGAASSTVEFSRGYHHEGPEEGPGMAP